MTGREVVHLTRALRAKGMSAEEILEIIEIAESHSPAEDGKNQNN